MVQSASGQVESPPPPVPSGGLASGTDSKVFKGQSQLRNSDVIPLTKLTLV